MGSEAAADANEEAEKNESLEIVSKVDGEDHAENPDPVSDLQEEVRDAEVDEHSSHHSTAEYHDVMGSEAEADDASGPKEGVEKEEPADIALNVEHDAEATSGTSHSAQSHLPQVFDIGSPKADEPGAEEATDEAAAAAEDDDFAAPHPDEEHLDVPSTGATKLHQECEDPDESGSECSDDEDSEASAYEVGGSDEEADNDPDCDGGPDPANLEPPATAQQSASLPEFFDIGSMDDSAPEADEPSEPKAEAAESAEAAAVEAKTEAAAAQAAAELEEAAAAEDSPKQNPDVRVMSQTDPQVNSSDKKMSMRIERASTDSQLVNPSAGLAKPSHAAGIGGSRALMGTGSTATHVLQRRGSMSLLEDPLGHTAQTVPQAQDSGDKITATGSTGSAMASGTQTGIDSVPGPVMKREVALCGRTVLEDGPWLPLRFQAATEVPASVKPDASGRTHTLPSSLLTRDPTKPRPKKTLRFSEHVDHRSISPRPRSATAPEASGMEDKKRTAQSGPSTATKPVPVQSSSFSEFLFLPPVPENKTEPPPQPLSNFLLAPNGSTAQHAVPAVEMESSRRSGEEHHASSAHHHGSDAHDSCQVDQMALEAHERDLACSLERRVLERAYFLFQNGHSDDPLKNYYTALRIEMSLSA
ncbi:rbcG [Symbiodinium sp. CCMP2456]|nr:rbcG [Symbiodinium sp. CCMP2456]